MAVAMVAVVAAVAVAVVAVPAARLYGAWAGRPRSSSGKAARWVGRPFVLGRTRAGRGQDEGPPAPSS